MSYLFGSKTLYYQYCSLFIIANHCYFWRDTRTYVFRFNASRHAAEHTTGYSIAQLFIVVARSYMTLICHHVVTSCFLRGLQLTRPWYFHSISVRYMHYCSNREKDYFRHSANNKLLKRSVRNFVSIGYVETIKRTSNFYQARLRVIFQHKSCSYQ